MTSLPTPSDEATTSCKVIVIADEAGTHVAAVPIVAALPDTVVNLIKASSEKVISGDRLQEYRRFAEDCRAKAEGIG